MYSVSRQIHDRYGNIVEITREEAGQYTSPFDAFRQASRERRQWKTESTDKIRLLVDGQVMTVAQADSWSITEYKSLPKCEECAKILNDDVFTHQLCGCNLFCSQKCADKNYNYIIDNLGDEEEFDL